MGSTMAGGGPVTSGTDTREPRALHPAVDVFDLGAEIDALRAEPAWREHGRAAKTLAKAPTQRLVLTLVRAGGEVGDDDTRGPLTLQVLEGRVTAGRGTEALAVPTGGVAWFAAGPGWSARADTDAALLLGVGWPEALAQGADVGGDRPDRTDGGSGPLPGTA
ncbi:MAG TPA: hypothetical protein VFK54_00155 [Candidatus Limnocylindrales bacterium]|nr:hypothetical protein [Candidatus Limnocylindrales bacterium]